MAKKKSPEPVVEGLPERPRLTNKVYLAELDRLQVELVKLQEWIRHIGLRVVVVFEGRDAAGKGGVIKTITRGISSATSRTCRLPARWSSSTGAGTTGRASSA